MKAIACKQLIEQYERTKKVFKTGRIEFTGVEGYDVYNISGDFEIGGSHFIAGRVEKRDSEISCVRFFKRVAKAQYALYGDVKLQRVQDPCVTKIDGDLVVGGTQIDVNPLNENEIINWRTIFFRGKDIESLKYWFVGPSKMKDVRLLDYDKDRILILSRPQGGSAGMGKIGLAFAKKGEYIGEDVILSAHLFDTHFVDGEWGGANEIFRLKNGRLGVLGHIAYMDREGVCEKHYHSMAFMLDAENKACGPVKLIARRGDFADGPAKRPDLCDVLFSGGLTREANGTATLYTGVSDAEGHFIVIPDPFAEYENN